MKYTSKIKSRQFILAEGKKIFIEPNSGEMSEKDAIAVAKSPWGKRLIETGSLTFEKPIEIKDEKVERGMTIPKGEEKPSGNKPSGNETGNEGDGDTDTDGSDETKTNTTGEDEIPDFDKNTGDGAEK